jgi:hypothetical protein
MHIQSAWSVRIPGVSRNLSQDEVNKISEKGKHLFFFVVGCGLKATELVLRKSTDGVSDLGVAMADVHTLFVTKVRESEFLVKSLQAVEPRTVQYATMDIDPPLHVVQQ